MKLIVGLGNPGDEYKETRHNVGFMTIDGLAGDASWAKSKGAPILYVWIGVEERVELVKPQTFMNKSGDAVAYAAKKHPELRREHIYVIHDDLDIPLGGWKLHFGKGPREHKGVQSIERVFKTKDFWRVRVGVDARAPDNRIPGDDYVLMRFTQNERRVLDATIAQVVAELRERVVS